MNVYSLEASNETIIKEGTQRRHLCLDNLALILQQSVHFSFIIHYSAKALRPSVKIMMAKINYDL